MNVACASLTVGCVVVGAIAVIAAAQVPATPPPPPVLTTSGSRGQAVPDPSRPVPLGAGEIRGSVVESGNGRPIAGAVVTLTRSEVGGNTIDVRVARTFMGPDAQEMRTEESGPPVAFARPAVTDGQGRFVFNALPAGNYRLSATRSPYLATNYGQTRAGGAGRSILLGSGQQVALTFPMLRPGSIEGTIVDELGAPLVNGQVQATRYGMVQGVRRTTASVTVGTDDRGRYRLFGLAPGDYYISAAPQGFQMQTLQRAAIGQASYERAIQAALAGRGASEPTGLSIVVPLIPDEAVRTFAPTYYPAGASPDSAMRVTVDAGSERTGVDITFRPVPMVRVRGIVSGSPGPHVGIQVTLSAHDPASTLTTVSRTQPDGSFTLGNVLPGTYVLTAATVVGPPPGGRGTPPAPLMDGERLSARTVITFGEQDVTGIVLALQPGRSISGTVVPTATGSSGLAGLQLSLVPAPGAPPANGDLPRATPEADGRFELRSVPAGTFTLRANRLLKSVVIDGQDVLDFPLVTDGSRDFTGAVVSLADRLGALSGTVNGADGAVVDITAVLLAADRRYWTPGSRRVLTSRADTGGRFAFTGVPAGDYLLAALADLDPDQMASTDFLAALAQGALRLTVADGGTHVQNIRLAR